MLYFSLLILFLLSAYLTYHYIRYAWRHHLVDTPNVRSSHTQITPRGGGLVFIALWVLSAITGFFLHICTWRELAILLPGTLLVAVVGFWDDRHHLSALWRLLLYSLAAIISIVALGGLDHLQLGKVILTGGGFITVLAALAIIWSINLFNFMDGLDGIAATEAIFVLSIGGFFTATAGGITIAWLAWILAACVAGFLVWNKPPAKIFMGDVGSATLGFIIMMLALWGEKQCGVPILLWLILYGVFLMDATLTLLRRLLALEPVYQAHRLHAYQRLNQAGFNHKKVLLIVSSVNLLLALLALGGFYYRDYLSIFALFALLILFLFYCGVERINPMYPK